MAVLYTFEAPESAPLDPGASRKHAPKVLMPEFGDGASQRAADGINNDPATREFSWTNLTEDEATVIEKFLKARNGWQSFYYDHKGAGKPLVYICPEWQVVETDFNAYTITATFKQVYDL